MIHVLGPGALGGLFALRLSGIDRVALIRRGDGRGPGLRRLWLVDDRGAEHSALLADLEPSAVRGPVRRLLVATKTYDVAPALASVRHRLAPGARLLLLQNGLGSQERVCRALPWLAVAAAVTTEGAWRDEDGRVHHAGRGITCIGALQGDTGDWPDLLRRAGFTVQPSPDIRHDLADKLRVNALINPVSVLCDCRNGELLERPRARRLMARLGREADAVLAAAGYLFTEPSRVQAEVVARATAANVSSMLQDHRAGRRLELDDITGALLALARRHGVPAKAHAAVLKRLSNR
jgi:2-dehydropantoate 2-reductase